MNSFPVSTASMPIRGVLDFSHKLAFCRQLIHRYEEFSKFIRIVLCDL
jgi:hypothetical protein